jgi:hypothetical protein
MRHHGGFLLRLILAVLVAAVCLGAPARAEKRVALESLTARNMVRMSQVL